MWRSSIWAPLGSPGKGSPRFWKATPPSWDRSLPRPPPLEVPNRPGGASPGSCRRPLEGAGQRGQGPPGSLGGTLSPGSKENHIEREEKRREAGELQKGSLKVALFQPPVQQKADLFTVRARRLRARGAQASGGGNRSRCGQGSQGPCGGRRVTAPLGA